MKKRIRLERIDVPMSCPVPWNSLTGSKQERACDVCGRHVYDITAMTASEAERLLRDRGEERTCIRIARGTDGHVITADRPDRVSYHRRSFLGLTVAAMAALFGIFESRSFATSRTAGDIAADERGQTRTGDRRAVRRDGSLSGTILDPTGAGFEATVVAINESTGDVFSTTAGGDGRYRLSLPKGTYLVSVGDGGFLLPFTAEGFKVGQRSVLNVTLRMPCMGECVTIRDEGHSLVNIIKAPVKAIKKRLGK